MMIISGTVLTEPQLHGRILTFRLQVGSRIVTVFRADLTDQRLDMAFLTIGLRVVLWGRGNSDILMADKIRIILDHKKLLKREKKGVLLHGNSAYAGNDPSDPEIKKR